MRDVALADRLREAREYLGLSEEQAAESLRWSVHLLRGFEGASYGPSPAELGKLAKLYRRPVDWFSGDWEWTPSPELLRRVENLGEGDREAMLDFAEFLQGAGPAPELTRKREVPGGTS